MAKTRFECPKTRFKCPKTWFFGILVEWIWLDLRPPPPKKKPGIFEKQRTRVKNPVHSWLSKMTCSRLMSLKYMRRGLASSCMVFRTTLPVTESRMTLQSSGNCSMSMRSWKSRNDCSRNCLTWARLPRFSHSFKKLSSSMISSSPIKQLTKLPWNE